MANMKKSDALAKVPIFETEENSVLMRSIATSTSLDDFESVFGSEEENCCEYSSDDYQKSGIWGSSSLPSLPTFLFLTNFSLGFVIR